MKHNKGKSSTRSLLIGGHEATIRLGLALDRYTDTDRQP